MAAALRAAAAIGPYFSVEVAAGGPGWVELRTLVDDPRRLRERVAATRSVLAGRCGLTPDAVDERATASIFFLGLAARLISPALGAAVQTGTVPVVAVGTVHWRPVDSGPIPIAMTSGHARAASSSADLADLLYDEVVSTIVAPVAGGVQREFRLSPKVVWGNVASALAGAAKMLGVARPDLAWASTELADRLLQKGLLAGTGRYVGPDPARAKRHFVRNNCCLLYRVPGGGICTDCVLVPEAVRRVRWRDELDRT